MMLFQLQSSVAVSSLLLLLLSQAPFSGAASAPTGYHYDPPSPLVHAPPTNNNGHYFGPLSTVAPLPPVPALPPLPTARSQGQALVQVHPVPANSAPRPPQPTARPTPSRNIAAAYRPPSFQVRQGYPGGAPGAPAPETQLFLVGGTTPLPPLVGVRYPPPSAPSSLYLPQSASGQPAPIVPASRGQAAAQPLRIPYGQQPVISYPYSAPENDIYVINGRQLKQYAVIEFTDDNDISQDTKPFLTQSFFNSYRAQVGASGTGAIAPLPSAMQLESRSSALVQEQQRLAQQGGLAAASDTIALGSGGLGFIRLPNGSVSLGSGSLGFITGQQHTDEVREARTRTGASAPDALHFGHGSIDAPNYRYRFK